MYIHERLLIYGVKQIVYYFLIKKRCIEISTKSGNEIKKHDFCLLKELVLMHHTI